MINPPTALTGTYQNKSSNMNIIQVKLAWATPAGGGEPFDKFYIYRNDVKFAEVESTVLEYYDEQMSTYNYATYYVTAVKTTPDPVDASAPTDMLSNYSIGFEELIARLRRLLMDFPADPRMKRWADEDLLEYINIGIDDINTTPPLTRYNLQTIPLSWKSMILLRARFEAYISRAGLEVAKEFNFGFGGVSMTIDRSGKYLSVSDKAWTAYNDRVTKAKLANLMGTMPPLGILSADLSFRIRTYAPRQYRVR